MDTAADCRDPDDNRFLALAFSGQTDLVLSGDDDFARPSPWRSIPTLSPAQYLAQSS